jgi:dihydropteroate synthase
MKEIILELKKSVEKCLEIGINFDRIIVDPGIGFGKTVSHNLELIHRLQELRILQRPVLIGPSRKSFIGYVLGKDVTDRLMGTAAAVVCAIFNGAHIVRIHDVGPLKDVIRMTDSILDYQKWQNL